LSTKYGENTTALFAFIQGIFIDIYSGCIYGLSPFLYLCVCLIIHAISGLIDIHERVGSIIAISLAMFIKSLLFIFIISLTFKDLFRASFFVSELQYIILTVLVSPIIFRLLDKV